MKKISLLLMLAVIILVGVPSCAPEVSQQEYDKVSSELLAIQGQLATLQGKLAEAELQQAQYEELNTTYKELSEQYDAVKSDFETMQAEYEELSADYEGLSEQYDAVKSDFETMQAEYEALSEQYENMVKKAAEAEAATEFDEEDVEQAIFELINQERIDNGIDELLWGKNIYKWAKENSRNMATTKRREYSSYASWQDIYWAAGHSTADRMANAAFIVWKDSLQYERNFLNKVATYGAVGVYKSGEIYYITYIASPFR